jgi:hypothetical protein
MLLCELWFFFTFAPLREIVAFVVAQTALASRLILHARRRVLK